METIYDLGTKMIESLTKEKVQSGYENFNPFSFVGNQKNLIQIIPYDVYFCVALYLQWYCCWQTDKGIVCLLLLIGIMRVTLTK